MQLELCQPHQLESRPPDIAVALIRRLGVIVTARRIALIRPNLEMPSTSQATLKYVKDSQTTLGCVVEFQKVDFPADTVVFEANSSASQMDL